MGGGHMGGWEEIVTELVLEQELEPNMDVCSGYGIKIQSTATAQQRPSLMRTSRVWPPTVARPRTSK